MEDFKKCKSRFDLWINFINSQNIKDVCEIGVYRGDFADKMLNKCPQLKTYHMIDPWENLKDWNKPSNKSNETFDIYYSEVIKKIDKFRDKVLIHRGETKNVVDEIADDSLDFVYVDGDHTLRGIMIDLLKIYPKIKNGGWIGGDDLCCNIFQHSIEWEPTLVFPVVVYFAEANFLNVYALPHNQFLIHKNVEKNFEFFDLTGRYSDLSLKKQIVDFLKIYIK